MRKRLMKVKLCSIFYPMSYSLSNEKTRWRWSTAIKRWLRLLVTKIQCWIKCCASTWATKSKKSSWRISLAALNLKKFQRCMSSKTKYWPLSYRMYRKTKYSWSRTIWRNYRRRWVRNLWVVKRSTHAGQFPTPWPVRYERSINCWMSTNTWLRTKNRPSRYLKTSRT